MNRILLIFFLAIIPYLSGAQLLPREGSTLHYRLIGFSCEPVSGAEKYLLEIAAGNYHSDDSFQKHIILSHAAKRSTIIAEVPYFGKQYTWRIKSSIDKAVKNTELHHFSTTFIPDLDSTNTRVRINKKAEKYKDAFVFIDGTRTLCDMKGHPVWYLPTIDGLTNESLRDVRDMKLTPQGTITFLMNNIGYEINYNGDILWKAPNNGKVSGDTIEHYHHEFTRLTNGHYMILGSEFIWWDLPQSTDSSILRDGKTIYDSVSKTYRQKIEFGTIIEYDEKGNVTWSWKSSNYFRTSDVRSIIFGNLRSRDVHENSFFFDEKEKTIYVSFRNISRILKVHYPNGNVMNAYGDRYSSGISEKKNTLFCDQHSVKRSQQGYLYLFNNNYCNRGALPRIIMMQEPPVGKRELKKVWEYECPIEGGARSIAVPFSSGGNVIELPDHSIFTAFANDVYSNIFIVSQQKKILWSAMPEKWNAIENLWDAVFQYRASIVTDPKTIEQLVHGRSTNYK